MLGLSIYWGYPQILKQPPRGPHIWRQTYTLAFALAFYEDNLYPLYPRNYSIEVSIFWWHNAEEWDKIYRNFMRVREEKLNEKLGIPKDALMLCMPNHTPCGCLYFIQRRGWSDAYGKLSTPELIEDKIKRGARYLFIGNTEPIPKDHPIWRYTRDTLHSDPPLLIMRLGLPAESSPSK